MKRHGYDDDRRTRPGALPCRGSRARGVRQADTRSTPARKLQHDVLLSVFAPFLTLGHLSARDPPDTTLQDDDIPEDLIVEPGPWS